MDIDPSAEIAVNKSKTVVNVTAGNEGGENIIKDFERESLNKTAETFVATLAAFALPIVIYLAGASFMQWLCWGVSGNKEILRHLSGM